MRCHAPVPPMPTVNRPVEEPVPEAVEQNGYSTYCFVNRQLLLLYIAAASLPANPLIYYRVRRRYYHGVFSGRCRGTSLPGSAGCESRLTKMGTALWRHDDLHSPCTLFCVHLPFWARWGIIRQVWPSLMTTTLCEMCQPQHAAA